jgi:glycosyltransferase involved in cell wall biosynthesis
MRREKKEKILFLLRLPPRLTGATLMNSFVYESKLLNAHFQIRTIKVPHSKSHQVVGELSIGKLFAILATIIKLSFALIFFRPKFVYFQISPLGSAFIRDFLFVLTIKIFRIKIVYHMHGKGIAEEQKRKYFKSLYTFAFKNEEVICLAESLKQDIAAVFNGKPYIVPNVIKKEQLNFHEKNKNLPFTILYISNLFVSKGIIVFIKSLNLLKQRGYRFKAHIVGNESEIKRSDLIRLFVEYNLTTDEVEYLGPKYGDEKWKEYLNADVLVFPTLNDIWGLVILEAMQASIPVIASIDGAIPEIIDDNVTGFLVEKNKPEQICEKLEFLQNNPHVAKMMGLNGRKRFLEKYSYEQFEKDMLKTFKTILE